MKTIVIIEDAPVLASSYRNKFGGAGFQVEIALDGELGMELITKTQPDVVLLDLQLPGLSGLEILAKVRANPAFRELPVVVLSSLVRPGAEEDARAAGASLVLSKFNTSPNRVLEAVKNLLEVTAAGVVAAGPAPGTSDFGLTLAPALPANDQTIRGNVLLVEAHDDMNALLALILNQAGHQVINAGGDSAALKQIGEQSFDLFVLGSAGPLRTHLSLCQELRKLHPHKPIILYSTAALFSDQQAGLKAGADAFLVKPEDLFNVGQIVSELIRNHLRPSQLAIRAA